MEHTSSASALIERAFAQARRSGKPEWWVMAIPVLKNRILQITGQNFKESDFGVSTFREFLQNNTDVLEIDNSFLPGAVTLKSAQGASQSHDVSSPQRNRIREDLWRAILDYSSGNRYVWDANASEAIVAPENSEGPFLPTISAETMTTWKQEFLAGLPDKPDDSRLTVWQTQSLPTAALPAALRLQWNRFVKNKVQSTLKEWFESHHIALPALVHPAMPLEKPDETELFREFVIKCIAQMSKEELEKLSIPSSVAFRVNSCR
jgi:hypothetical protein